MKRTILFAIGSAVMFLILGNRVDAPVLRAPVADTEFRRDDPQAGLAETEVPGIVREVTAYNVGVRKQTGDEPCIGATGIDLCRLIEQGRSVCAANFVALGTILRIKGYGECIVLDRMNRRYAHRVDVAMREEEVEKALEFGLQRRVVEVK